MQEYKSALWKNVPETVSFGMDSKQVGRRLEITRQALDYKTASAFADALGITPQKWNNYTSGRDLIPLDLVLKICARYGITTDWIYRELLEGMSPKLRAAIEEAEKTPPKRRKASKKS